MEEENKLPLKRVELPLSKFNEVAIPHHLDLLRQHKTNIIKYEEAGEYGRMRTEQMHARRVASQLRALLGELEALRRQVRAKDVAAFDRLTQRSRDLTLRAIMDYLGVIERSCIALVRASQARRRTGELGPRSPPFYSSPMSMRRAEGEGAGGAVAGSAVSTESVGVVAHSSDPSLATEQIQLQVDERELELREREAALRGWGELQAEVRALHDAWQHVQAAALAHREQVTLVSNNVEVAADNVETARSHLAVAEKLKAGAYGAGGALVGALVGGPVGLVLGVKAGAAALLAGSALGFVGARILGRRRIEQLEQGNKDTDSKDAKEKDNEGETKKDR